MVNSALLEPAVLTQDLSVDLSAANEDFRYSVLSNLLKGVTIYPEPDRCWEVRPELVNEEGYGVVEVELLKGFGCPLRSAHRESYKAANPRINLDLEVDGETVRLEIHHMCRNEGCFRPSHLRPVTREENEKLKHCQEPRQRHTCKRYFDVFYFRKNGQIRRRCSVCEREKKARYRQRKRAAASIQTGEVKCYCDPH